MQVQPQPLSFHEIPLLEEALSRTDDWTSLSDRKERRRVQNRLYQRASRRRKNPQYLTPLRSKLEDVHQGHQLSELPNTVRAVRTTQASGRHCKSQHHLNVEDFQKLIRTLGDPDRQTLGRVCFPPTLDHLIPMVYTNIYRAIITNNILIRGNIEAFTACSPEYNPQVDDSVKAILSLPLPPSTPPSLYPTPLQMSIPHPLWMDVLPMPSIRDAFITSWVSGLTGSSGKRRGSTECALALDLLGPTNSNRCGGGCCSDEEDRWDNMQGLIVWGDPWVSDNWEVTERFMRRWGWIMRGCREETLKATNRWRDIRGLEPLVWVEESVPELCA